ncbi:unnamed protein product [Ciceribacter selenitireducens ATCC BAA-1503]|uniref:Uncharacterized protein n=1 Tax=Ciceribacter selenitireducens ATCC BAA-1503 TaxID=1336235 RepID=A0A376AFC9_9HYPH|nr:unnamed protein product [Ciceribacter selenitireducens ATCC BAA-1503]
MRARGIGREPPPPLTIEAGFCEDGARRIAGAQEQDIEMLLGHGRGL